MATGMIMGTDVQPKLTFTPCGNCGTECSQSCAKCRKESYCSKTCQKAQLSVHRPICFPAREEIGDGTRARGHGKGSFWVATRDIDIGERIFTDHPLIVGPGTRGNRHEYVCIACHSVLKNFVLGYDWRTCSFCGWPICSLRCPMIHRHVTNECHTLSIMSVCMTSEEMSEDMSTCESVRNLRVLLLSLQNPNKWRQLQNLYVPDGVCQMFSNNPSIKNLLTMYKELSRLHHLTDAEILRAIVIEKYHRRHSSDKNQDICEFFVYDKETRLDFSCAENCLLWKMTDTDSKKKEPHGIALMAARKIEKGERLTISAFPYQKCDGTITRRRNFESKNGFKCQCIRCADPTELGTYMSAIKCSACMVGYLLPYKPLDENSDWACNSESCSRMAPSKVVFGIVDDIIQSRADRLLSNSVKLDGFYKIAPINSDELMNLEYAEKFVEYWATVLHPNHYILLNIQKALVNCYMNILFASVDGSRVIGIKDRRKLGMKGTEIKKLRELAEKFIVLGNKIFPQLSAIIMNSYYFLAMSIFCAAEECARNGGCFWDIMCYLTEGNAIRIILESYIQKLIPAKKDDSMKDSLRCGQYAVVGLCHRSPIYRPMLEKLYEYYDQNRTTVASTNRID